MATTKKCKVCGKPFKGEGDIGPTCAEHEGLLGKYYITMMGQPDPDEFISLVELCDIAEKYGKSRYWMVILTGKDGGTLPPLFPEFTIYQFGGKKYCRRSAIGTVRELALQKD
jgi:hypothetical protein